jgi:Cu-Zn family superoxide dismutase
MRLFSALVAATWLAACATAPAQPLGAATSPFETNIQSAEGQTIGSASFTEGADGVLIRLQFNAGALTPGWHGVHFHQVGDCTDAGAGFRASGAHVGHGDTIQHGLLNPAGPEPGDLPNIYAPAAGAFSAELFTTRLTLGAAMVGDRMPLRDADGAALVVHAGPDDHMTQPIGGAGARVACATLTPG